ncbi:MAG: GW dipeptide domain-containing protein [Bacteroidales bacterium]|nr:GW dipeptide domain-containing protein [Bacteroidales bacterium]
MKHIFFLALVIALALSGCNNAPDSTATQTNWGHTVKVADVIQTTNYTYLEVAENGSKYWMAIPKSDIAIGKVVYYNSGLPMTNFESKELKRTFDKVLFVQVISDDPAGDGQMAKMTPAVSQPANMSSEERVASNKSGGEKKKIEVDPLPGGMTLADVINKRSALAGKEITVKGVVTKYNAGIMNRNWLHIQDGTETGGYFDMTITTNDEAKVGDIVVFKGTLNVNKDFGAGYTYEYIIEDATLQKEM